MKKLLIAAAIVSAAAFTQAGTVSWTLNKVYDGNTTDLVDGKAYMFTTASGYDNTTIVDAILAAYSTDNAGWNGVTTFLNSNALGKNGTAVSWTGANGDFSKPSGAYDNTALGLSPSTEYTMFAVIFNEDGTFGDDTKFFVTNTAKGTTKGSDAQTNTGFYFGAQNPSATSKAAFNSQIADNWHSVPEPTSGLLLLLGVAGLALKRRRA